jgi:type III secretion protein J
MSLRSRKLAALLVFAALLGACKEEAFRGLSARDTNEMFAILAANGISASREFQTDGSGRLMVEASDLPRAIQILSAQGYPREPYRSLADVFPGDGLIVSPLEQRARLVFALSQELTRTVSMIDGVTRARVHLVMPEMELRGMNGTKPSASVAIHHRPGIDAAELSAKVRGLVANGVPGLSVRDVTVATFVQDIRSNPMAQSIEGVSVANGSPLRLANVSPSTILWLVAALAAIGALFHLFRGGSDRAAR